MSCVKRGAPPGAEHMEKVCDIPIEEDIESLYRYLRSRGVAIWVTENEGRQEIWVKDPAAKPVVLDCYQRFKEDPGVRERLDEAVSEQPQSSGNSLTMQFKPFPCIAWLLLTLLAAALYTGFGDFQSSRYFFIIDRFQLPYGDLPSRVQSLLFTLQQGEWWRLLSPAWLHLGLAHWLFNSLALWIFGRSLEVLFSRGGFVSFILGAAIFSNLAQYLVAGPAFGGFSGVAYALVGAHAAGWALAPSMRMWAPSAMVIFSIVWMLAGMLGVSDQFGVSFANTAHFVGFWFGLTSMALWLKTSGKKMGKASTEHNG